MVLKSIAFVALLAIAASAHGAQLYMSTGKSVFEIDSSGQLITSVSDPNNIVFEGLAVGPDNRLYVGTANITSRVDSFSWT